MRYRVLPRKEKARRARFPNTGLLEYFAILMEPCERVFDGVEVVLVDGVTSDKVAEVVVRSKCPNHLFRYMALDSSKIYLRIDVQVHAGCRS